MGSKIQALYEKGKRIILAIGIALINAGIVLRCQRPAAGSDPAQRIPPDSCITNGKVGIFRAISSGVLCARDIF